MRGLIMNCQQANRLLPLWIGRDLADTSEAVALRAHLAGCPGCSTRQRQLQDCLDALQSVSTNSLPAEAGGARPSLWPRLSVALKEMPRRPDRFNGWIPASAMALAASLMIAVSALQIRREIGDSVPLTWGRESSGSARNLFQTDRRFAPGATGEHDLQIRGLVVQPATRRPTPNF